MRNPFEWIFNLFAVWFAVLMQSTAGKKLNREKLDLFVQADDLERRGEVGAANELRVFARQLSFENPKGIFQRGVEQLFEEEDRPGPSPIPLPSPNGSSRPDDDALPAPAGSRGGTGEERRGLQTETAVTKSEKRRGRPRKTKVIGEE